MKYEHDAIRKFFWETRSSSYTDTLLGFGAHVYFSEIVIMG